MASLALRNMTKNTYERGIYAEQLAQNYLEEKGFVIVASRYRTPYGEIDLLMRDRDTLVAVEVKYRKYEIDSFECLHIRQKKRIENALLFYISENDLNSSLFRFDVVLLSAGKQITHLENAWQVDES